MPPSPPLSKITPNALRRTYISPMLEAGAPLPYVMDQVGREQISRTNVNAAFDRLLTGADSDVARSAL